MVGGGRGFGGVPEGDDEPAGPDRDEAQEKGGQRKPWVAAEEAHRAGVEGAGPMKWAFWRTETLPSSLRRRSVRLNSPR